MKKLILLYLVFALILFFTACQKEAESFDLKSTSLNGTINSNCTGDFYVVQSLDSTKIHFLQYLDEIRQLRVQGNTTPKTICLDNNAEIIFEQSDIVSGEFFNIPEGVTLKSNGAKIISHFSQNSFSFSIIENSNITIEGITFKAPLSQVAWQRGLQILGDSLNIIQNISIKNCDLSGFNEVAIRAKFAENIIIDNNYVHHNFGVGSKGGLGYGISVGSGASVTATNNRFLYNRHAIASSNVTENSYYEARNNVILFEYENDPIVNNYSQKQALLSSLISIHHFDAHGTDGNFHTGGTTGSFTIEDNVFYNNRVFSNTNKIIDIRGVPRECSSIKNNVFPSGNGFNNIRQNKTGNYQIIPQCSNNLFINILVSGNTQSSAPPSSSIDNLIVVKENGELINYPNLNDLKGEGVLVGHGFLPSTYTDFLVGNWTGNGSSDLIIRSNLGDLKACKFSGTTFYGQTINGASFPIVGNGFLETTITDYLVGNWTGNGTSDLIVRNNLTELKAGKFNGITFYGQTIGGVVFPVVSHGLSDITYTDYFVGNWTGNGTSDLIVRNNLGELKALKFNGTTFYGQTIGGQSSPVVAHGVGSSYTDFLVGDWTNDGISDLLLVNQNGTISINKFNGLTFYGQGIGSKTNPINVFSNTSFEDYYVGDFTDDNYPDLLVVNDTNDLFLLKYNPIMIKFENPELITTNFKYSKILVGNWNN